MINDVGEDVSYLYTPSTFHMCLYQLAGRAVGRENCCLVFCEDRVLTLYRQHDQDTSKISLTVAVDYTIDNFTNITSVLWSRCRTINL